MSARAIAIALALPAGERDAALADHGVVAVGQLLDELVRLREPRGADDVLVGRVGRAERDVLPHRRREEERVLGDDPDRAPQGGELDVAHVHAVDGQAAGRDVVETRDQGGQRRLARARVADERDRLARRDLEVDLVEHRSVRRVLEARALEHDVPVAGREVARVRRVGRRPRCSSITSKIRSPDAVARCAWPIHMPSIRSGMTSMSTSTLNAKN